MSDPARWIDWRAVAAVGCLDPRWEPQRDGPPEPVRCGGSCPLCHAEQRAVDAETERHAVRARIEHLLGAAYWFLDEEDDHEPGKWIQSPDVRGQMIQLCAGEGCGMYWPCSVERFRRVVLAMDMGGAS